MPKPNNLYRINCMGGSTTGSYIFFENKNCSYPLELEKNLFVNILDYHGHDDQGYTASKFCWWLSIYLLL